MFAHLCHGKSGVKMRARTKMATVVLLSMAFEAAITQPPRPGRGGNRGAGPEPIYSGTEPALVPPTPRTHIELVTASAFADRSGDIVLTATCAAGRQLLGGGFFNGASAPHDYAVSTKANYPLDSRSWRAVFRVHSEGWTASAINALRDAPLVAYAYCLNAPGVDLDLVTITATNAGLPRVAGFDAAGAQGVKQEWSAPCPAGAVVTGGGFRVEGSSLQTDAIQNADVRASMPTLDANGVANGWRVAITALRPDLVRTYSAIVRCARANLTAMPAGVLVRDLTQSLAAIGEHFLSGECPPNGVTTAGGAEYRGDFLIPHPLFRNRAENDYSKWSTHVFGGYQTTNYEMRPCDKTTAQCLVGTVVFSCFAWPDIPFISVNIVSPPNGYHFDDASSGHDGFTKPLVLTARVYDRTGQALPNAVVRWSYSTSLGTTSLGTGNPLVVRLPAGGAINSLYIRATATSPLPIRKGRRPELLIATASIQVGTGTVP